MSEKHCPTCGRAHPQAVATVAMAFDESAEVSRAAERVMRACGLDEVAYEGTVQAGDGSWGHLFVRDDLPGIGGQLQIAVPATHGWTPDAEDVRRAAVARSDESANVPSGSRLVSVLRRLADVGVSEAEARALLLPVWWEASACDDDASLAGYLELVTARACAVSVGVVRDEGAPLPLPPEPKGQCDAPHVSGLRCQRKRHDADWTHIAWSRRWLDGQVVVWDMTDEEHEAHEAWRNDMTAPQDATLPEIVAWHARRGTR